MRTIEELDHAVSDWWDSHPDAVDMFGTGSGKAHYSPPGKDPGNVRHETLAHFRRLVLEDVVRELGKNLSGVDRVDQCGYRAATEDVRALIAEQGKEST